MDLQAEDWLLIGLFSGVLGIYVGAWGFKAWANYQIMKMKLDSAISGLKTGHSVARQFLRIVANVEMTGKKTSIVVSAEFAEAMYSIEKDLREKLELLEA